MKQAFLVLGPESSGTRLVTQLLIGAGCFGDGGHEQRLDRPNDPRLELLNEVELPADGTPIVWRRSFPHAGVWVDIASLVGQLHFLKYEVTAVITTRDWFPMIQSQHNSHKHVPDMATGLKNVQKAYQSIFRRLPLEVPFVVASYESICQFKEKAVHKLLEMLQLPCPIWVDKLIEGNGKWYNWWYVGFASQWHTTGRNAMTETIPLCRWRESSAHGFLRCHSQNFVGSPNRVDADICRTCAYADHEAIDTSFPAELFGLHAGWSGSGKGTIQIGCICFAGGSFESIT